ncbi:gamma-glutamyl-gamma-aminobutyrate hydrolase family protein [Deltaproteobacteria bacterium TL4]
MKQPLIGLTTYGCNEKQRYTLPVVYVEAVRRAGGIPLLIVPGEPHLHSILEVLDGMILTGGGDIHPNRYGGTHHKTMYQFDHGRDQSEMDITQWVLNSGMPMLCICRGAQVLNVTLGGTLIEHIPDEVGEKVLHRAPLVEPVAHEVRILPYTRLANTLGVSQLKVMSWHHQALRKVADPLKVVAFAEDDIIEAVELPSHPWLLAVQWHPELTAAEDPLQQNLFNALVEKSQRPR